MQGPVSGALISTLSPRPSGRSASRISVQRLTGMVKSSEKPRKYGEPGSQLRCRIQPKALASRACFGTPWKWCSIACAPQQIAKVEYTWLWVQSNIWVSSSQ